MAVGTLDVTQHRAIQEHRQNGRIGNLIPGVANGGHHGEREAECIQHDRDFEIVNGFDALLDGTGNEDFAVVFEQGGAIEVEGEKGFG